MAWEFPKLSRRNFLKASGYGSAALTLLQPTQSGLASSHSQSDETTYTICNFCSSLCNVKVTSRTTNGVKRIIKLDGNANSTLNRGKICARGQSGVRQVYDIDRLKTPLIREEGSKRGEWKFRQATWEEAWDYIAKKNKQANIQPWEWTMVGGWTSCIFYMNWSVPFAMSNQIPNIVASPMQHCVTTGHLGTDSVVGTFNVHDEILPDYDNAKYIVYVGNNASIAAVSTCRAVRFTQAKKNGAKVVVLDPRLSETAAKADEWVPIRPGTDLDFCLAMLREMLVEGLYDSEFLRAHTNMPFLVYQDKDGQWHLSADKDGHPTALRDGTKEIRSLPSFTNDNRQDIAGEPFYPALFAPDDLVDEKGHKLRTVMQAQMADVNHCTPEWASKTTGIPADTIRRIIHEFGSSRPSLIDPGWHGARYSNMMMARRVQAMIQMLNGGIDRRGGWILSGELHHKLAAQYHAKLEGHELPAPLATKAGMDFAMVVVNAFSKGENFPHGHPGWSWAFSQQQKEAGKPWVALPVLVDEGLKESVEGKLNWKGKPYLTRGLFINAANPVRHYYPDTYWEEILSHKNIEIVIAVDVLPADTTAYADVILPNSTYLERSEPAFYGNGVNQDLAMTTRYAATEPLYDTREVPDMLLKMTEIISGKADGFIGAMEALVGIPAKKVTQKYQEYLQAKGADGKPKHKNPFMMACRDVAMEQAAERLHTTPESLDKTLRERGIFHEENWHEIIKHYAVPYKLPTTTASGRIEYYSSLFDMLRGMGGTTPHFSVMAKEIPAQCRSGKKMDDPLADDEFYFAYGKLPTVSHASTNSNNPVIAAINHFKKDIYTGVWIHPDRAQKLGIKMGDPIKLTNSLTGQGTDGVAYVTRKVRSDTIFIYSAFGVENKKLESSFAMKGTATNKLVPRLIEPVVAGFRSQEFTLRVARA